MTVANFDSGKEEVCIVRNLADFVQEFHANHFAAAERPVSHQRAFWFDAAEIRWETLP